MNKYLHEKVFTEYKDAMIYVERTDSVGNVRAGIVGKIDLEQYDYSKKSTSFIRATEATVAERIPARVEIRNNAVVELPHVMLLVDDAGKHVIEPCEQEKEHLPLLYDFEFNGTPADVAAVEKLTTQLDKGAKVTFKNPM